MAWLASQPDIFSCRLTIYYIIIRCLHISSLDNKRRCLNITIMVLVTTCLLLKWLHQWFFDNAEQEHHPTPTVKIKLKLDPLESKKCVVNEEQSFLEKELQSVKAVLDMRESELRKLRKLLDKEIIKDTRHNWSQTSQETSPIDKSSDPNLETLHPNRYDQSCSERGRSVNQEFSELLNQMNLSFQL